MRPTRFLAALLVLACTACHHNDTAPAASGQHSVTASATSGSTGHATVVWVSVDGTRPDYIDRAPAPFIQSLMHEGYYTRKMNPGFPSLTFPSHATESTGTTVSVHGIPANSFYDPDTQTVQKFPTDTTVLKAEPIWNTATRQGVTSIVLNWPMCGNQSGPNAAAFFHGYIKEQTDEDRLREPIEDWEKLIAEGRPPRLIMTYCESIDGLGHKFGPNSAEVPARYHEIDALLARFADDCKAEWHKTAKPGDSLYLFITTDHGMRQVENKVAAADVLGHPGEDVHLVNGATMIHVFLPTEEPRRSEAEKSIIDSVKKYPFARVWKQSELPAKWNYVYPGRTGDLVVLLSPPNIFSGATASPTVRAVDNLGPQGFQGMHGYDPAETPEMFGFSVLVRLDKPDTASGGHDLGEVRTLRYHPTVAKLLGIQPSAQAKGEPLDVK